MAKETKSIPIPPQRPPQQDRGQKPEKVKNDNNLPNYTPPPPPPPPKDKK